MIKSKIFLKVVLVISSMIAIYTSALFFIAIPKIDDSIQKIEQKSAKEILYKVATITKNFDKNVASFKELSIEQHKSELQNLTDTVWSIIQVKYNQSKPKKEVVELVNKLNYNKNNYYFISDYNNILLSHPYLQGEDLSNRLDIKGNLVVPPMVKIAREKGEGFHKYWWKKNKSDDISYEKLTFVKDFPDWNMVIGTGVYIDGINKEIEKRKKKLFKQLRKIIKTTTIGKTGYLYIFSGDGKMLIHPNSNIDGKNTLKLVNPTKGTYLFDDLVNASNTKDKSLYYKWDKPSDKGNYIYNKVSWVEYIPELDWYIGSSVYIDEIKDSSNNIKQFIIILSILLLIILTIYSFIFFRNLLNPIVDLSKIATKVSQGNYSVRLNLKQDDEVGVLSDSFNKMVTKVEESISEVESKNIKLQESINNFQALLNTTIEAIVIFEDGYCIDSNESTYKLFGYKSKDDMHGIHALSFIAPKSKEFVIEKMKLDNTLPYEANCIKQDGTIFPALIKEKNIEINNKHVRIAVLVDLTELKQKDKQIIEQIRLAQLGEMISMIAHQWRQPLNVLGALNMKVETKLDFEDIMTAEGYKPIADDITRQLSFMSKTIDDFRDFFKPNKEKQDTSFSELVHSSLSIIKSSILNNNIELILELNSKDRFVIYKNELTQVLLNILKNSQDILIQRKIENPYIKITSIKNGSNDNCYTLIISDNAGGIDDNIFDKVFDPYFSTKSEKHGSGLGLYMSKTIIEEHCLGKLSVKNDKDGAKFIIELPV
ncbi:MAG: cache domain-containing protein [Campylobacterota bacterium]|nr:cache domain-containing protein [Campylobacterota bacterium]